MSNGTTNAMSAAGGGGIITGTLTLNGQSGSVTFPKQMSMVIVSWSTVSSPSIEGTALLAPGSQITASASGSFAGNITFDGTELAVGSVYGRSYLYNYVAFE